VGNTESMKRKWPELVRVTQVTQRSHRDAIRVPRERCVRRQRNYEQNLLKRSASLEITRVTVGEAIDMSIEQTFRQSVEVADVFSACATELSILQPRRPYLPGRPYFLGESEAANACCAR
jgi:hypothetical protein